MSKTAKIAISLPQDLLENIDSERLAHGESRSGFFRRAIEAFLRHERDREAIEQYIRGYQEYPETEEEIGLAQTTLPAALVENPWEDSPER